jgi:hypothetical protein
MMARRKNDLFIGKNYLNQEGLNVKHPGRISLYANPNINKIKDKHVDLVGLDIETDAKTAEMKLLGFWNGEKDTIEIIKGSVEEKERMISELFNHGT